MASNSSSNSRQMLKRYDRVRSLSVLFSLQPPAPILQLYKISSWLVIKDGTFKSQQDCQKKKITLISFSLLKGSHAQEMESQLVQVNCILFQLLAQDSYFIRSSWLVTLVQLSNTRWWSTQHRCMARCLKLFTFRIVPSSRTENYNWRADVLILLTKCKDSTTVFISQ